MLTSLSSLRAIKWLPFALGAFAIASVYLAYRIDAKGYERGRNEVEAAWDKERLVQLQSYAELQSRYSEITHQLKQDAKALSEDLRSKLNENDLVAEQTIASLRSGNLRLRNEWRQCSANLPGASSDSGTPVRNDDADQAGVPSEAVERILRIGLEADQMAIRLQSCQEWVRKATAR